jgi:hypothetical protein
MDDFLRQFIDRVIVPALVDRLKESPDYRRPVSLKL